MSPTRSHKCLFVQEVRQWKLLFFWTHKIYVSLFWRVFLEELEFLFQKEKKNNCQFTQMLLNSILFSKILVGQFAPLCFWQTKHCILWNKALKERCSAFFITFIITLFFNTVLFETLCDYTTIQQQHCKKYSCYSPKDSLL